jgi:hypothetical protein
VNDLDPYRQKTVVLPANRGEHTGLGYLRENVGRTTKRGLRERQHSAVPFAFLLQVLHFAAAISLSVRL